MIIDTAALRIYGFTRAADELDALRAENEALRAVREAEQRSPCLWSNDGDMWEAPCGAAWMFEVGGPKENDMSFCHKCGHPLITTEDTDEDDDALLAARAALGGK